MTAKVAETIDTYALTAEPYREFKRSWFIPVAAHKQDDRRFKFHQDEPVWVLTIH